MARRRLTPLQKEYNAQVNRINALYNEMKRQGVEVVDLQAEFNSLFKGQKATRKRVQALREEFTARKVRAAAGLGKEKGVLRPVYGKRAKEGKERLKGYIPEPARTKKGYLPSEGDMILQELLDMIDDVPSKAGTILRNELSRQIQLYGRDNVTKALAAIQRDNPELIEECRKVIRYDDAGHETSKMIRRIAEAITGEVMKEEDRLQFSRIAEEAAEASDYGL